ncbi:class I SAM-dependent methyltransferase [Serratia sp. M24T3]|uniref:methyltransferase domain-containing protein n=1 Tax=Serratia sp. M24T3 TaxID=932213 RepID=UPI00025BC900|nr:class I SAM-dependent methyltransferase [Serratia sp. M24T3]EIC85148.1 type 11 methyltransferase [Serratia sp. M24T3]
MKDSFYSAFEKKYRGSRELIGKRLEAYIPIISPLLKVYPGANALDLGCGRGEWLEMATHLGFDASGVDLDEGMLSYCIELNLKAEKAEAISSLKALPDNSIALISSFHLIEHIGFDNVRILVDEALRVLKPGGLLILETPNAENIQVGTNTFHLDPTHDKPIPYQLLEFLAEYAGFSRTKVMRLQEPKHISQQHLNVSLSDVLLSVSPDYSVVAQKGADESIVSQFHTAFDVDYGVSLIELAKAYDENEQAFHSQLKVLQEEISTLKTQVVDIETTISTEALESERLHHEIWSEKEARNYERWEIKESRNYEVLNTKVHLEYENAKLKQDIEQLQAALEQMTNNYHHVGTAHHHMVLSRSWKITKPYRFVGRQVKYVLQHGPVNRFKQIVKRVLVALNYRLARYPGFRTKLISVTRKAGLEKVARRIYLKAQHTTHTSVVDEVLIHQDLKHQLQHPELIPPAVKDIFSKLK